MPNAYGCHHSMASSTVKTHDTSKTEDEIEKDLDQMLKDVAHRMVHKFAY